MKQVLSPEKWGESGERIQGDLKKGGYHGRAKMAKH
jgi:hypothetical protein